MNETIRQRPAGWLSRLLHNPVTIKELRSRMRGRRAFVILTAYLLLMSLIITLVYLTYAIDVGRPYGPDGRNAGKVIFFTVLTLQGFLVVFIGPAFTAGAISGEKERQTYDLLRATLLSANALVFGKLTSALSYVLLLILASIPLQSMAFFLGGVAPAELVLTQIIILVSAVAFALLGLFISSVMRSTLSASVTTFTTAIILIVGFPFLLAFGVIMIEAIWSGWPNHWLAEVGLIYLGLALVATHLPATLFLTELFLLEWNAIFYFTESFGGWNVPIISPWIFHVVIYTLVSLILYLLTVWRVKQVARK